MPSVALTGFESLIIFLFEPRTTTPEARGHGISRGVILAIECWEDEEKSILDCKRLRLLPTTSVLGNRWLSLADLLLHCAPCSVPEYWFDRKCPELFSYSSGGSDEKPRCIGQQDGWIEFLFANLPEGVRRSIRRLVRGKSDASKHTPLDAASSSLASTELYSSSSDASDVGGQ